MSLKSGSFLLSFFMLLLLLFPTIVKKTELK